jgi:hypothetical protein
VAAADVHGKRIASHLHDHNGAGCVPTPSSDFAGYSFDAFNPDLFVLSEGRAIAAAVIELRRAGVGVVRHLARFGQSSERFATSW